MSCWLHAEGGRLLICLLRAHNNNVHFDHITSCQLPLLTHSTSQPKQLSCTTQTLLQPSYITTVTYKQASCCDCPPLNPRKHHSLHLINSIFFLSLPHPLSYLYCNGDNRRAVAIDGCGWCRCDCVPMVRRDVARPR